MKTRIAFHVLFLPFVACTTTTVTIFAVGKANSGTDPNSHTIKPIGTGKDGATTYLRHEVVSLYYEIILGGTTLPSGVTVPPTVTRTYSDGPKTEDRTIVADASHYAENHYPTSSGHLGQEFSCSLDGKGGGGCVRAVWEYGGPTTTRTYTGDALPVETLVVDTAKKNSGIGTFSRDQSVLCTSLSAVLLGILFI